jgi:putative FmdB family regulatory protein
MPTYEYKSTDCDTSFEELCPMDQRDAIKICPESKCKSNNITRSMSTGGVVYKDNEFRSITKTDMTPSQVNQRARNAKKARNDPGE